jgi:hypothetical protein
MKMATKFSALTQRLFGRRPEAALTFRKVLRATVRAGFDSIELSEKGSPVRLGRGPSNDLVLEDVSVSSQHAKLKLEGGTVWVCDLNSRHGTILNHKPLVPEQWVPVRQSDRLLMGQQEIALDLILEPPQTRPVVANRAIQADESGALPAYHSTDVQPNEDLEARTTRRLQPNEDLEARTTRRLQPNEDLTTRRLEDAHPRRPMSEEAGRDWKQFIKTVLTLLALVLVLRSCVSSGSSPRQPGEGVLSDYEWQVQGTARVPQGGGITFLSFYFPEVSLEVERTIEPEANGLARFDIAVPLKARKTPTRFSVQLRQGGTVIDSAQDLALPSSGESIQLPPLGK